MFLQYPFWWEYFFHEWMLDFVKFCWDDCVVSQFLFFLYIFHWLIYLCQIILWPWKCSNRINWMIFFICCYIQFATIFWGFLQLNSLKVLACNILCCVLVWFYIRLILPSYSEFGSILSLIFWKSLRRISSYLYVW